MIKVIRHGYKKYRVNCDNCRCYFEYEISDVNDKGVVNCPDCGKPCQHNAVWNADTTSKFIGEVE